MDVRKKLLELMSHTSLDFEEAVEVSDYLAKSGVIVQEWIPVKNICEDFEWCMIYEGNKPVYYTTTNKPQKNKKN